jgi:hypothetical protein
MQYLEWHRQATDTEREGWWLGPSDYHNLSVTWTQGANTVFAWRMRTSSKAAILSLRPESLSTHPILCLFVGIITVGGFPAS